VDARTGFAHLAEDGFTETGSPSFDLTVSDREADSLRPFVGIRAGQTYTTGDGIEILPHLDLAYSYELMNAVPASVVAVGGGRFAQDGVTPSRSELTFGGGVSARVSDRLVLFATNHAVLPTGNTFIDTIEAGLRYSF
jgi:outer membrane autotransporter protein